MAELALDVVGVGNAIVDVLAQADDGLLNELGLDKGAMTLIGLTGDINNKNIQSLREKLIETAGLASKQLG